MIDPFLVNALEKLQDSWQPEDKFSISTDSKVFNWRDNHPLSFQLSKLRDGKTCSLPYFKNGKVNWVTFGGSHEELLESIEDLRCWVLPYLGKEESTPIVTKQNAKNPHEQAFSKAADMYFRWYSAESAYEKTNKRLKALFSLLNSRPTEKLTIAPSLSGLRLDFISALCTREWIAANEAIGKIDYWQLDTAKNTLLMRIRMLYEKGDFVSLVKEIDHTEILHGELPYRIRGLIIDAIYQSKILPIERSRDWKEAFSYYQDYWQSRLAVHVITHRSILPSFPLSAYHAYFDRDRNVLRTLYELHSLEIAGSMLNELLESDTQSNNLSEEPSLTTDFSPSIGRSFWKQIEMAVRSGDHTKSRECIDGLTDTVLDEPEWISIGAETLLEIFTDPLILDSPSSKLVAEEVLVAIIDTVVYSKDFPRREHSLIYDSLIATWVAVRKDSNLEQDGRLLLGLVGAAIQCSTESIHDCESAIRSWWVKRQVEGRLPWLIVALDTLILNHSSPANLEDLWIGGAELITRFRVKLSKTERYLWQQIGRSVGIDEESIQKMIVDPIESEETDLLATHNLRKVAIVSLNERAARQAAEELKSRTGADIIIITSKNADDLTKSGASADLILFVWSSCTHAVYRAFDHVREKLQYVAGTGPSSIILAAEQWALRKHSD